MSNIISNSTTLQLANSDASGNTGYTLDFDYQYDKADPASTIKYTNVVFSGPGSWDDFSEGDEYPYSQMLSAALCNGIEA